MKSLLAEALIICFAAPVRQSTSCTRHPAGKSTRSALRNVVTAALAFRSITSGMLVPRRRRRCTVARSLRLRPQERPS
jgi:hypothetical protein